MKCRHTWSRKPRDWKTTDAEWSGPDVYYGACRKGVELQLGNRKPVFLEAETARRLAARIFLHVHGGRPALDREHIRYTIRPVLQELEAHHP